MLPVGLASVMTYVGEYGYDFDLLDVDAYDMSDDQVEAYIKANKYDVFLCGSIVTHYKWMKWLTHTIKKYHPDSFVIVGNSVAGSCYNVFMSHAPNDVTVIGEGEVTTVEVLDAIKNRTPLADVEGVAYRDGDTIRKNPPRKAAKLEDLPMVNWDYFDVERYLDSQSARNSFGADNKTITMPVVTARGCAFRCTFCHFVFWDDPYRFRKPEDILAEIKRNMEKYGAKFTNYGGSAPGDRTANIQHIRVSLRPRADDGIGKRDCAGFPPRDVLSKRRPMNSLIGSACPGGNGPHAFVGHHLATGLFRPLLRYSPFLPVVFVHTADVERGRYGNPCT